MTPPATPTRFLEPSALMRIRSLELRARIVVEGFRSGLHRSPYHGFSAEFSEYRQYVAGDDIRHIDWRVYARSDRYYVKKYEDETNLRCQLLVDGSRSMAYGSDPLVTKHRYAATLAATLAYFLTGQGDAVGVTRFDDQIRGYLPARNRPGHLRRLMLDLEQAPEGRATSFGGPLERVAQMHDRRGMFILFSDLLAPLDDLKRELQLLRARGHEVLVFRVLDRREIDFDFDRSARFTDLESGRDHFIDPGRARSGYLERFGAHEAELREICQQSGIDLVVAPTDLPVDGALHDFLSSRTRRGPDPGRTRTNLRPTG
ncbi:DUF58 domain-containing protein [Luteolibacter marinus]|uniref:DUF58 domain-containing protein n=1 Tax=Luteolibacter marinus TaxID=2776705 RepID=UPI001D00D4F8|nr:DUF58 domain-containing protein [Luteolibacter marinus]